MIQIDSTTLFTAGAVYIGLLAVCAGRFAFINKSVNDPYDVFDYVSMVLMAPFFIVHKIYRWFACNWAWFLFEWIPTKIYNFAYHLIFRPIRFVFTQVFRVFRFVYTHIASVIRVVTNIIRSIYTLIYNLLNALITFVLNVIDIVLDTIVLNIRNFFRAIDYYFVQPLARVLRTIGEYLLRRLINLVRYCVDNFERFLVWIYDTLHYVFGVFIPSIIRSFVTYLKYVWNGIYDNLLYPAWMYLIYYPFYVGMWQHVMLPIYNSTSVWIYHFYCVVWDGCARGFNRCYEWCAEVYANMGGGYERLCNFLAAMYEELSNRMEQAYNNLSIVYEGLCNNLAVAYERFFG